MKNKHLQILLTALCVLSPLAGIFSQTLLEGYVYEQNNRGYLNQVKVLVRRLPENVQVAELTTNHEGYFSVNLLPGEYLVIAGKDIFFEKSERIRVDKEKSFVKLEMQRRPGYLFDATLAEVRESPDKPVDAIQGATIEIYNRTAQKPELVIVDDNDAFFQFTFERGNHYTMLIRKEGYLSKRIEVYVNINGCIICVDGVRDVSPGVTENLTSGNEMGTLLANIELDKAKIDKRIQVQNIYYDYDKWFIRPDAAERLNNVVQLMLDNPGLSVELGSHTDSRGNDDYNESLSQKRAQAAVAYIIGEGVDSTRITAKGYGEKMLVNRCGNGVECSEAEHQQNRRTELRITGIVQGKMTKSLEQIIKEENAGIKDKSEIAKSREKRLPEANNSVPVPNFQPDAETATPAAGEALLYEYGSVRILQLPASFKGYAVEIITGTNELSADNRIFSRQKEVFHWKKNNGEHAYYLVNLGPKNEARAFFSKKIQPQYPGARLALFTEEGIQYPE